MQIYLFSRYRYNPYERHTAKIDFKPVIWACISFEKTLNGFIHTRVTMAVWALYVHIDFTYKGYLKASYLTLIEFLAL